MAKRLVIVSVVVLLLLLLLPGLGMAMTMDICPMCEAPLWPGGTVMCIAVLGGALLFLALLVSRAFDPAPDTQPLGPPGPRLYRPPRS